jgi:hypothetical protein
MQLQLSYIAKDLGGLSVIICGCQRKNFAIPVKWTPPNLDFSVENSGPKEMFHVYRYKKTVLTNLERLPL